MATNSNLAALANPTNPRDYLRARAEAARRAEDAAQQVAAPPAGAPGAAVGIGAECPHCRKRMTATGPQTFDPQYGCCWLCGYERHGRTLAKPPAKRGK